MKAKRNKLLLLAIIFGAISCISIPKQAPLLSEEIGVRIGSIEQSHLNLLHVVF